MYPHTIETLQSITSSVQENKETSNGLRSRFQPQVKAPDVHDIEVDRDEVIAGALITAVEEGYLATLTQLLEDGANCDLPCGGTLPLHVAAAEGNTTALLQLLDHGARIDMVDSHHKTALHRAAFGNRIKVVKILLKLGANPNIKSDIGRTALDVALSQSNYDIASLLTSATSKT